jgi:hypothetical protein
MGSAINAIKNQIYVEIKVQDQKMPMTPNMIDTLSMNESISSMTPTAQLTFTDLKHSMVRDMALVEGTKITVLSGKFQDSAVPRKYRIFGIKQVSTREGPKLVVNCVYDAPEYITGSYTEAFKGTSSSVIEKIAKKCSLKADVTSTSDDMTWLNFGQTRAAFTEDIAIHGYNGESSCMLRGLTSSGIVRYKDAIEELNKTKPKVTLALNITKGGTSKLILVRDIRDVSVSGAMNSFVNYGWKYPEHSLKGKEILHEKYKAKTTEKYLPINSEIKGKISNQTRVEYCTKLDCRNTHDNYHKAYYINMRGRALLCERLHLLIEEPSEIQLMDIVEFKHAETDGHVGKGSGNYFVTAKVVYITNGSQYFEKLELCRAAVRESGNTQLEG